jgi:hypothetical protein
MAPQRDALVNAASSSGVPSRGEGLFYIKMQHSTGADESFAERENYQEKQRAPKVTVLLAADTNTLTGHDIASEVTSARFS